MLLRNSEWKHIICHHVDLNKCKVGKMSKILKGMGTNTELYGGIYQAIMLTGGYIMDEKKDPEAVCEHYMRYPQTIEHYFSCHVLLEKYGWMWTIYIDGLIGSFVLAIF